MRALSHFFLDHSYSSGSSLSLAPFTPSPCHTCEWLFLFDSTYSHSLLPSIPPVRALLAKRIRGFDDPTGTVMGRSQGITSTSLRTRSRRNARRRISRVSTTGSSATRNSARICLTSVALKKYVLRWTNWRTKTTRTTLLQKKLVCTATIGGSVRTS